MTPVLLGRWPDRSPEWLAARQGRVGGSDIGVIMGWSRFATRDTLLAERLGEVEPKPTSEAMLRGIHMEPAIRSWLTAVKGVTLLDDKRGTYTHSDHPWAMCNPDDTDTDGVIWEYKAPQYRDGEHGWGRAGSSSFPLAYQAQLMWNLGVMGATEGRLCVWAGAPKFYPAIYKLTFNPDVFAYLLEQGRAFLDDYETLSQNQERAA